MNRKDAEMIQFLKMARSGGAVTRYHTVKTVEYETIAQHSWGVAMLVIALSGGNPSLPLLKAALYHDLAEQISGDSPATAKWSNPGLKRELDKIENKFNKEYNLNVELTPGEEVVLKYADTLDMCFYCVEQRSLGNKNVDYVFRRGIEHLRSYPTLEGVEQIITHLLELYGG